MDYDSKREYAFLNICDKHNTRLALGSGRMRLVSSQTIVKNIPGTPYRRLPVGLAYFTRQFFVSPQRRIMSRPNCHRGLEIDERELSKGQPAFCERTHINTYPQFRNDDLVGRIDDTEQGDMRNLLVRLIDRRRINRMTTKILVARNLIKHPLVNNYADSVKKFLKQRMASTRCFRCRVCECDDETGRSAHEKGLHVRGSRQGG